jgi:antitoxin component YwqK of YwqJK toxin-antitoxin module
MSQGNYKVGLRDGVHQNFFPDGRLESEITYKLGKKDGHAIWYTTDTTGKKHLKHIEGEFKNDIQNGHWIYYQAGNQIGNEGEYLDGKMSGLWTWYFDTGDVWKKGNYKNGLRNGLYTVYFENGKVYYTGVFKDDKEEGLWKRYNESGRPEIEGCFHGGKMDSIWKEWFDNGVLRYEITYKNNLKDGPVIYYDETGMKTMIITFKEGAYDGKYTQFNETGVAVVDGQYVMDKKNGEWIYRQADSKIIRRENYNLGRPSGTWTEYYPNGTPQTQKSFNKNGALDGKYMKFDRYGKTTYEAVYSNGKLKQVLKQPGGAQNNPYGGQSNPYGGY